MAIIDKVKKRKNPAERIAVPSYEQTTREDTNSLRDSKIAKLEKKRIKKRVKQAKKNLKE
jgi:hypothetical protein